MKRRTGRPDGLPATVSRAGFIVAIQGGVLLVLAVVMVIRSLAGEHSAANGYGTAAWFGIIGAGVAASGYALTRGRRGGRAISVMLQLLLIPVGWAMATDSELPWLGIPLLAVVIVVLVLLFWPASVRWFAADYAPDAQRRPSAVKSAGKSTTEGNESPRR